MLTFDKDRHLFVLLGRTASEKLGFGFRWSYRDKGWVTPHPTIARQFFDEANKRAIGELLGHEENIADSWKEESDLHVPVPEGLELLPYQVAGVDIALWRKSVLLADEVGLGKTIQAVAVCNMLPLAAAHSSVLIICPNSLVLNWEREWRKWTAHKHLTVATMTAAGFDGGDVVIVGYGTLGKYSDILKSHEWDFLICDEAHYLKGGKSQRSLNVLGGRVRKKNEDLEIHYPIPAKRRLFLTGSPILNRPIELWPLLKILCPNGLGSSWLTYVLRYCAAYRNKWGWQTDGASNLEELQERLRASVMIRRTKKQVLRWLPEKQQQMVILSPEDIGASDLVRQERDAVLGANPKLAGIYTGLAVEDFEEASLLLSHPLTLPSAAFISDSIFSIRARLAEAKVPSVVEHLLCILEEVPKVVCFCHHRLVANAIHDGLIEKGLGVCVVTGSLAVEERQVAVDHFQREETCRAIVGTFGAIGTGFSLAASVVVLAEVDWVPGVVDQAIGRCHGLGRGVEGEPLLVYYVVVDKSLDAYMVEILLSKRDVISRALDAV